MRKHNEKTISEKHVDREDGDRHFVSALARGMHILRVLSSGEILGTNDIAERTGFPLSSVSRLCYTLVKTNYIDYLPDYGKYKIGDACIALGYQRIAKDIFPYFARPMMKELAAFSGVAVSAGINIDDKMVYIVNERGNDILTMRLEVGSSLPILSTAMGHAYLAGLEPTQRNVVLQRLAAVTPDFHKYETLIQRNIEQYEKIGYCSVFGLWYTHINAVGLPIRISDTNKLISVTCGGLRDYLPQDRVEAEIAPRLIHLVRSVEKLLEGQEKAPPEG